MTVPISRSEASAAGAMNAAAQDRTREARRDEVTRSSLGVRIRAAAAAKAAELPDLKPEGPARLAALLADRELYQQGGARAVAVASVGEDAPEEVIQAKAVIYERWVQEERATRAAAAEDQIGAPSPARQQADVRLKRSQVKHTAPRGTGFSMAVQLAVWARAGSCCEACGIWLARHEGKVGRRRAGAYPFCGMVHNACLFCGRCYLAAEQRDPRMNAAGFWLASKEDPREVPVMLHNVDCRVWLTQAGNYSVTPPEGKTG